MLLGSLALPFLRIVITKLYFGISGKTLLIISVYEVCKWFYDKIFYNKTQNVTTRCGF